ncbi:MAG: hypothetical protein AB7O24_11690 [Kofleriaceae bacterium]
MHTSFIHLNSDWNAEPNAPEPLIRLDGQVLRLTFAINAFDNNRFKEGDQVELVFSQCWRYRLGSTNDEGWHAGQCRFSGLAPRWGEFYEIRGDLLIDRVRGWRLNGSPPEHSKHFLFYFRDETFECDAADFAVTLPG